MKISKFVTILLVITIIFSFTACNKEIEESVEENTEKSVADSTETNIDISEDEAKNNAQPQTSQDVNNNEIKISVSTPEGWEPVEGSAAIADYNKDFTCFSIIKVGYTGSLDDVVEKAKEANENYYDEVKYISEVESIKVDDNDARSFIFTFKSSNMFMIQKHIYTIINGNTYLIFFSDFEEDSFYSLEDEFKQILDSIEFK